MVLNWDTVQRTARPKSTARIRFFSRFNEFLEIEKQLETLSETSFLAS